ncbi:MAG: hypothetical protein QXI16_00045 [Sulfolobaceae archaeon]
MFELFGKFLKIIMNMNVFVAYVKTAVITAEEDKTATGSQKRDAVVQAVLTGLKNDFGLDLTGFETIIEDVVNLIVNVFNALGVFKHSSKSTVSSTNITH